MNIMLLGATGSIGTTTCSCVRQFPDTFHIGSMSTHSRVDELAALAHEFLPAAVCITDIAAASGAKAKFPASTKLYTGPSGLEQMVAEQPFDKLLNAIVGYAGLRSTVTALMRGKFVALANKESLVVGGELIRTLLKKHGGTLFPVDSEHSALQQCLQGEQPEAIERVVITASGGPFRTIDLADFNAISPADALQHPTWQMGAKITIDSATLMNKGFEIIEAHHLFGLPYDKIDAIIHPESIIHSLIEFHDGAVMAQMGVPSMEVPIYYALSSPKRLPTTVDRLRLSQIASLHFEQVDYKRYPCLKLCLEAARSGGAAPVTLNAANEIAVSLFLDNKIGFTAIAQIVSYALENCESTPVQSLTDIEYIDTATREKLLGKFA